MSNNAFFAEVKADERSDQYTYGCFFCMTGDEHRAIDAICAQDEELEAMSPEKIRIRRFAGKTSEEKVRLFPGYVFFRAPNSIALDSPYKWRIPARLLTYGDNDWILKGTDASIIKAFWETGGVVKLSTAYYEGNRIRILDGFLKRYEGLISRVNHRAKTAEIKVVFHDKTVSIWLGFELIERVQESG